MKVAVLSAKGGVGKTTSAVNLGAYLARKGSTVLIDSDLNRSAVSWARRGEGLPFDVLDITTAAISGKEYEHRVIDTPPRPPAEELKALVAGCDQIVVCTMCDALAIDALFPLVTDLQAIKAENWRVLLTAVPPVGGQGAETRELLKGVGLPLFKGEIRRYIAHAKAALAGVVVSQADDPHADEGWSDYQAIGRELTK